MGFGPKGSGLNLGIRFAARLQVPCQEGSNGKHRACFAVGVQCLHGQLKHVHMCMIGAPAQSKYSRIHIVQDIRKAIQCEVVFVQ